MATCYRCGRPISSADFKLRRRVKTGEYLSRRYPNPHVASVRVSYGMRTVCGPCAYALDWAERQKELRQYWELGLALAVLLGVLLARLFGLG